MVIYPNPTKDKITIWSDLLSNYNLDLYTIDGRLILSKSVLNKREEISLVDYPVGTYILKLKSFHNTRAFKIVKFQ